MSTPLKLPTPKQPISLATPSAMKTSTSSVETPTSTELNQVPPLRGGLIKGIPFTGGSPLLDSNKIFSSTTTTSFGPPSYMAIRSDDISTMMKIETGAKMTPSTLFESASDATYGLMTYIGFVHRHFQEYGMDAIFYFPTGDGTLVSIIEGHSQFAREEIHRQSTMLYKHHDDLSKTLPLERYDMYDVQNLRFSAAFILASISPALRAQVLTKAGKNYDNGPIVWMFVMGLVQSSSYRGTKLLQKTFEDRKLKLEAGENVIKHTIHLRNDYMRLFNANMVPHDALMTVIDSLIDSSTPTFSVWAATKRISISRFLKDNAGKAPSALWLIDGSPTIEAICDEADDEYQSLVESGLWIAQASHKDSDAAPTAYLLAQLSSKVDKLTSNFSKREGTCWTCGKEGHMSPNCPDKSSIESTHSSSERTNNRNKKSNRPTWQQTRPALGEGETLFRNNKTWYWCEECMHWSTTHGTSMHGTNTRSASASQPLPSALRTKVTFAPNEQQGQLAEVTPDSEVSTNLSLGAWCGITTESTNDPTTSFSDATLGSWITNVSRSSKKKQNCTTCEVCQAIFYCPRSRAQTKCHWCTITSFENSDNQSEGHLNSNM